MRDKRSLFRFTVFIFVICSCTCIQAIATGLTTKKIAEAEKIKILSAINVTVFDCDERSGEAICCFDISEEGLIAIGFDDSFGKSARIYDMNGNFMYGFLFECSGSFGLELNGENLTICFMRSDVAATFDENGVCISLEEIQNTTENESYWRKNLLSAEKTFGSKDYVLKNNMGILNIFSIAYSQLVEIDSNGYERMIYDSSNAQNPRMYIALGLIAIFVVSCLIFTIKKANEMTGDGSNQSME